MCIEIRSGLTLSCCLSQADRGEVGQGVVEPSEKEASRVLNDLIETIFI